MPATICTLHFLQVPCPPQVESMAMPFQLAPSKTVTPGGTRTVRLGRQQRHVDAARAVVRRRCRAVAGGSISPSRR